ncbi:MAG: OmpH family outer membrane protein [Bacteroidales bacterium]|nr:OmpH family outer membrane protein [Bacteroidales bacterium]
MKKIAKIFAVLALFIGIAFSSQAQTQAPLKVGYVDFNTLLQSMPGIDTVRTALQKHQGTLTDQMDQMRAEFENKYLDYQSKSAGMSDIIKQNKEQELQQLQERIDAFQQQAQQDLQAKQQQLLQPLIDEAKAAVATVAKEKGYTYVLNAIEDVVLYSTPGDNLMPAVKLKLGIQ